VDAQCDKLATVVGRQFIILSVHLRVQHYGRNAPSRAGLSVAAETCIVQPVYYVIDQIRNLIVNSTVVQMTKQFENLPNECFVDI